jgi:hypothetical protein
VRRLRLPRRAPRNVAHESTVTRPQSEPSANAISNFAEADLWLASLRVHPEHNFRVARDTPTIQKCGFPEEDFLGV